jgi:hypothetical protein
VSSLKLTSYVALKDCTAGGFLRRAGERFAMPALEVCPKHLAVLEEGTADEAKSGEAKAMASIPKNARPGKDDLGAGKAKSSADVNSADIIKK